jgi:hypothetical protein
VVGFEIDVCVGSGRLSVYVYFEMCGFSVYVQAKKVYVSIFFVCRVEFYAVVYLFYVSFNEFWLNYVCITNQSRGLVVEVSD